MYYLDIIHYIPNRFFLLLLVHNIDGPQNSLTVEFLWHKIEGNLKWATREETIYFRRANTELSMHFRKGNTELFMHFRRANTETYWKKNATITKKKLTDIAAYRLNRIYESSAIESYTSFIVVVFITTIILIRPSPKERPLQECLSF